MSELCKGSGKLVRIFSGEVFCRKCFWSTFQPKRYKRNGKLHSFGCYGYIPNHNKKN